jgi:hypothetical protein
MIVSGFLFAALAGLSQPTQSRQVEFESETLFCTQHFRDESGGWAAATIEVDRDYSNLGSSISYRNRDFSAEWWVTSSALDANATLISFEAFADLPVGTNFPVEGRFDLDGNTVWRRSFSAPSGYLFDAARMPEPAEGEARCLRTECFLPRIVVRLKDGDRVDLFAASRSEIVAESNGRVLAKQAVALPDWKKVNDFARTAMTQLEQQVVRRECEPTRSLLQS